MRSTVKRDDAILLDFVFYIPQIKRNVTSNCIERSLHVETWFYYIRRLVRMLSHGVDQDLQQPNTNSEVSSISVFRVPHTVKFVLVSCMEKGFDIQQEILGERT